MAWAEFNAIPSGLDPWHIGSRPSRSHFIPKPNKYLPHIGAKQRSKALKAATVA